MLLWNMFGILALVFANGFFVAAEFALVSIRRSRVEQLIAEGSKTAKVILLEIKDLDRYIAGTQVGITIASLGLGWIGESTMEKLIEPLLNWLPGNASDQLAHIIAGSIAFIVITVMHVVLGELVPKSVALQRPEQTSLWVARPMMVVVKLFQPLIWGMNGLGNLILRSLGFHPAGEHHGVHSVEELEILVRQSHEAGIIDDLEEQLLQRSFRFASNSVSDVMIPRPDIVGLDLSQPLEKLLDRAAATIHSRLPLFERSLDNVVGIVYVHELFRFARQGKGTIDLRAMARPPLMVPEACKLDALLLQFQHHHTQIAMVIDEFGGTAGLITLEDLIEEVFGEIHDTLEAEQPGIQRLSDGRVQVRGDTRLDELKEEIGWELHDDDAETIAGVVMNRLGRIARVGDSVETPFGHVQVTNMARLRITQVTLRPRVDTPEA